MELPHSFASEAAEASMLALLLMDEQALAVWVHELADEHFRNVTNKSILAKIKSHYAEHGTADITAFGDSDLAVEAMGILEHAGTSAKAEYYFAQLEHARRIRAAAMIVAGWTDYEDKDGLDNLTTKLMSLSQQTKDFPEFTMKQLTDRAMERWENKTVQRKTFFLGIPVVDDSVKVKAGNMVYIVAPPKTGKTWLEVSIANHLSIGNKVYLISAEMHPDDIYTRLCSKVAEQDLTPLDYMDDVHRGKLDHWGRVAGDAMHRNLVVVKGRGMNFGALKGKIMSAIQRGFDIIMLDYLQRIKGSNQDQRIATMEMSRELTDMAGRYEKLFIVASQAGRAAKQSGHTQAHHAKECVCANTMVGRHKAEEHYRLFRDGQTAKVPTYNFKTNKKILKLPTEVINSGKKPCFEITTKSGRTIIVSTGTLFMVPSGQWVKTENLKIGDKVLVKTKQNTWNRGKKVPKTQAMLDYHAGVKGKTLRKPEYFSDKMKSVNPIAGRKGGSPEQTTTDKMKIWRKTYVHIYKPDHPSSRKSIPDRGYVPEHRYIIEKAIGRTLGKIEVIHHIDGDKSNNRLENLMLCESAKEHAKIHIEEQRFVEDLVRTGRVVYDRAKKQFVLL